MNGRAFPRGVLATRLRVLVLAALLCSSCAPVKPWERGRLAHDCMQLPVDEVDAAYVGHVASVREGSGGGLARGGGGCGCN